MEVHQVAGATLQPALSGLELPVVHEIPARPARAPALSTSVERRTNRHRYWSIRDLSRRLWLGRGYELLCDLIRAGILPATRSARNWWIADQDVQGLLAAFDPGAGKVRAFRGLEQWLRERCWVLPVTQESETLAWATQNAFIWRGVLYLPKNAWKADVAADGKIVYRHTSGLFLPSSISVAA